ncbi:hypothetical protein DN412_40895 [Cupriavidus lacunae]|uniref:Uncharacterized protein n=2 Tax=Cupriavidus lacunae TaxID=2666307 RepID=A0A370MYQ3_9BURK|nr:hypothetical protein DN412_40895 [Cupriavidus lacunae]
MKRDAFRKLFFFTPPTFLSINASTNVHSYISIKDNDAPNLLISTYFHNKHGWLFIEKLSIMADGDVILEQDFPHSGVKRDNSSIGVEESYDFVVAPQQLTALRKVSSTTDLKIRITGGKGYYTLPKDRVKEFKEDIRQSILIFDAIDKAVAGKIPTTETKS